MTPERLCLCVLVLTAPVQFSYCKYPVSFNDAMFARFSPETFNGSWISDSAYMYQLADTNEVVAYNVVTNETTVLVNHTLADKYNISVSSDTEVTVSADGKWVAIKYDDQSVFRHSASALYTFYELGTGYSFQLAEGERVQLVEWAPVDHAFAFVLNNDVFYQKDHNPPRNHRITNFPDVIYNGVADWVYEEEVLEDTRALWFSPGGTRLVFSSMDDTNVRNVTIWKYGVPGDIHSQYVEEIIVKYPKAGTKNPLATLNYVDLQQENITFVTIPTPVDLVTQDNILGPVAWADEDHFSATWMTRLQTLAYTFVCDTNSNLSCKVLHKYQEDNGWLTIVRPVFKNASAFFTILPQDQGGSAGNFRQLCLVTADLVVPLTKGLDEVMDILAYDKHQGIIYYDATEGHNSAHRHVYAVKQDGTGSPQCLTCKNNCDYGSVMLSKDASYYVLSCYGPSPPTFDLYDKNHSHIAELGNNEELKESLENVILPVKKDLEVNVKGFTVKVRLLLPFEEIASNKTKFPLLFNVYSGPGSNKIADRFNTPGWDEYLVTSRNIIIAYMDGRGSGLQGDKLKFQIYHKMGGPEVEDILIVAKYLQDNLPYVDPKRTAVWGWSYGGFAAASALSRDDHDVFKCGIAVAPVTNWIYYDTVYTERYMGLPTNDSNLAGYLASDISARVENFRRKQFYLIHGNADDNVHYQQSMMLSRALELKDILFYQQSYPDETHALRHVRRHLYLSMDKFWSRCFNLEDPLYSSQSSFNVSHDDTTSVNHNKTQHS